MFIIWYVYICINVSILSICSLVFLLFHFLFLLFYAQVLNLNFYTFFYWILFENQSIFIILRVNLMEYSDKNMIFVNRYFLVVLICL